MTEKSIDSTDKPWLTEPDEVSFEASGFACKIKRAPELGHLCGYVYVPPAHPYFGLNMKLLNLNCHGGITYSREDDGMWCFGFDCAHYLDIVPRIAGILKMEGYQYRTIEYVTNELNLLAKQLIEVASEFNLLAKQLREVAPNVKKQT